jgi:hypothetical protein
VAAIGSAAIGAAIGSGYRRRLFGSYRRRLSAAAVERSYAGACLPLPRASVCRARPAIRRGCLAGLAGCCGLPCAVILAVAAPIASGAGSSHVGRRARPNRLCGTVLSR